MKKLEDIKVPEFIKNLGEKAVKYYVGARKMLTSPEAKAFLRYRAETRFSNPNERLLELKEFLAKPDLVQKYSKASRFDALLQ